MVLTRATGDLGVWIAFNERNALKMVDVLKAFGYNLPELKTELLLEKEKVIRMGFPPIRLEILTSIDRIIFNPCYKNRVIADLGE